MQRRRFNQHLLTLASQFIVYHSNELLQSTLKPTSKIVGGGFAGVTCARQLKKLNPQLDVTLLKPKRVTRLVL